MKKICLVISILLMSVSALLAQNDQVVIGIGYSNPLKKNEFQLNIGDPTINMLITSESGYYDHIYDDQYNWMTPDTYTSAQYLVIPLTLSYHRRINKWFWVGGLTSFYGRIGGSQYDIRTDQCISNRSRYTLSFAPSIRFSYLNKPRVMLYSSLSVGVLWEFSGKSEYARTLDYAGQSYYGYSGYSGQNSFSTWPFFQLTYFGVSWGNKWFGNAELGIGMKGFFSCGMGYRF